MSGLCVSSKEDQKRAGASSERGSVLVFLPGLHEICHMQEALAKLVHKRCASHYWLYWVNMISAGVTSICIGQQSLSDCRFTVCTPRWLWRNRRGSFCLRCPDIGRFVLLFVGLPVFCISSVVIVCVTTGHPVHQYCREFSYCSWCQIW